MVKLQARVNPETRMLDLSDGRSLPISAQYKAELFPDSTEERLQGEEMSKIRNRTPSAFGEALFKVGEGSSLLKGPKDVTNYIASLGEAIGTKKGQENLPYWERQSQNYQAKRKANEALSQEISQESPTASLLGTGAGIGIDLASLRGLSGTAALPVMEAAGKGTDLIRNPLESLKDIGTSAAAGFVGDRIFGPASKMAGRRGAIRQNAADAATIAEQNAKGEARNLFQQQQVAQNNKIATDVYKQELEAHKQAVADLKNQRLLAVHQREVELNRIANQKTADAQAQAVNDRYYKQAKEAWDKDIKVIDAEHKLAEKEYEQALKELPKRQQEAQAIHSEEVLANAQKIERVMARDDRILASQINPQRFFEEVVNVSEHAGSAEAREAQRFITTLFPENAIMDAKDLVKRYQSLEKQIAQASPNKAAILLDFKKYLGDTLPGILESNIAYRQIMPSLKKDLLKELTTTSNRIKVPTGFIPSMEVNLNQALRELTPQEFITKIGDKTLATELVEGISKDLMPNYNPTVKNGKVFFINSWMPLEQFNKTVASAREFYGRKIKDLQNQLVPAVEDLLEKYLVDIELAKGHVKKRLGKAFERTLGQAPQVGLPVAPVKGAYPAEPQKLNAPVSSASQNVPAPIPPFVEPPIPAGPQLQVPPGPFSPQAAPLLAPAQGFSERMGDTLENFQFGNLVKGATKFGNFQDLANNPLAKLALLKGVLGKAAVPLELGAAGGIAALKGLTAPTTLGAFVREAVLNQGNRGLYRGFDAYARGRYQTYRNGVIAAPEERFRASFDVENDPQLNIEEKAMLQKKINRGEPLI